MKRQQPTPAVAADQRDGFEPCRKPTRRDALLATMEPVVPWQVLCSVIDPRHPKAGNGRPPIGLERMRRTHLVQHGVNLTDEV